MSRDQFEAIVIRNFLNAETMSRYLKVDVSVIEAWINEQAAIPDAAIMLLMQLDSLLSQACEHVIQTARSQSTATIPLSTIPVITYLTESDFQIYCEDAKVLGSVSIHQGFVMRVISELRHLGFNAYRVPFDQHQYLSWLQSQGYINSSASRLLWAAEQQFDN
jgi:hypothetical protein